MSAYGNTSSFVYSEGIFSSEPWQLVVSTLLVVIFTALASAAGIGGGGLVVPVFTYVLGTGVYYASPISTATILGVAIGKNVISVQRRHPSLMRPLINYDLGTYIQMTVLLGTIIGVVLHGILPEIIVTILLALVLGYSGITALRKGARLAKKEAVIKLAETPKEAEGLNDPNALETVRESPRADDARRGMYISPSLELELTEIHGSEQNRRSSDDTDGTDESSSLGSSVSTTSAPSEKQEHETPASDGGAKESNVSSEPTAPGISSTVQNESATDNVSDVPSHSPTTTDQKYIDLDRPENADDVRIEVTDAASEDEASKSEDTLATSLFADTKRPDLSEIDYKKERPIPLVTPTAVHQTHDDVSPELQSKQYVRFRKQFLDYEPTPTKSGSPSRQRKAAIQSKIMDLFRRERRCFWWEDWLALGAVTAFMLIYSLVKSEIIFIWETCDTAWWIW